MSSLPVRPRELVLVPVGPLAAESEPFAWLEAEVRRWLDAPVSWGEPLHLRDEWRSQAGDQVDSNRVVDALIERDEPLGEQPPDRWKLGLSEADLFAPQRDFVFGEAAQGGAWAVVSLARLRPGPDAGDPVALLRRRLFKEVVHELGHVAGLAHCDRSECVMYPSVDLGDTDRKSASLCPACSGGLDRPRGSR